VPAIRLTRAAPYFPVHDVARTLHHYEQVLGFTAEYTGGDPLEFAIVARDGLPLMLRAVASSEAIVPNERQGGRWDAFFWVEGIEPLAAELRQAGADIVYGPTTQPYGVTEMAVRDLDGHVLGFGEEVALSRPSPGPAPTRSV
jgi:catechol 2,3-dioxygenase-like lactoylglutathione lyase family enzyme